MIRIIKKNINNDPVAIILIILCASMGVASTSAIYS